MVAVGVVYKQKFADTGLKHPVAFFSRALNGSERNYRVYELEMYAVVRATEHFRIYLLGAQFHLRTDHAALVNLLKRDLPPTTRVQKWILRLSEYVFTIEYQKGERNVIADALSRLPIAIGVEVSATSDTPPQGSDHSRHNVSDTMLNVKDCKSELGAVVVANRLSVIEEVSEDESSSKVEEKIEKVRKLTCVEDEAITLDLPISRDGATVEDFRVPLTTTLWNHNFATYNSNSFESGSWQNNCLLQTTWQVCRPDSKPLPRCSINARFRTRS